MPRATAIRFSDTTYPRAYASTRPGCYRLQKYLDKPPTEIEEIEGALWTFVNERVRLAQPITQYKAFPFVGSGWEWSVFRRDRGKVVKIPAGIFPEVDEHEYLDNSNHAYQTISRFFAPEFIAETEFMRMDGTNTQTQEYVCGSHGIVLGSKNGNKVLLKRMIEFVRSCLSMLEVIQWLPDFDVRRTDEGFNIRNIIVANGMSQPKIVDFTSYYDVFRLYPNRTENEVRIKTRMLQRLLAWCNDNDD